MTPEAAAVFAQVIPTLMIATFLGNIGFHRIPTLLRNLMLYILLLAILAEFALLYAFAFGEDVSRQNAVLSFAAVSLMMLLIVLTIAIRMGSKPDAESSHQEDNGRKQ